MRSCKRLKNINSVSGKLGERQGDLKKRIFTYAKVQSVLIPRLGRSVKGLVDLVNGLEAREVHFRSLTDGIDTKTPAGRFFFHIMASLAQMERELIVERTRAGLAAARKVGRVGGRKRRMTDSKIKAAHRLLAGGTLPRDVAENLGVSVPTLYRWLPASAR